MKIQVIRNFKKLPDGGVEVETSFPQTGVKVVEKFDRRDCEEIARQAGLLISVRVNPSEVAERRRELNRQRTAWLNGQT